MLLRQFRTCGGKRCTRKGLRQPDQQWQDPPMPLDFLPLANAVARLDQGLARYTADITDAQIRDGLIQRFEFT